ncbi:hypothetical protein ACO0LL_20465 [Undibacterium sp. TC4M20W]|uniref:hypothetical protein n=1 Tax=Undibacterium sp. TC4M20W TaxID=3413052 RepID=UPI003BF44AE9
MTGGQGSKLGVLHYLYSSTTLNFITKFAGKNIEIGIAHMELVDIYPSLTITGMFAGALWLCKDVISTRLKKSVEHEFNKKIETVRSQIRDSEERLKAEIRIKEVEIAALRSGALSALASRQIALDKRRLEAVDQLWESVTALAPARGLVGLLSTISFEKAANETERDPKAREAIAMMGNTFDLSKLNSSGASKARPFLTPMVWATYSALLAVVTHSAMLWFMLKSGHGNEDFTDNEAVFKLIKVALPHYSNYIDEFGSSAYHYVLQALDGQLLLEIQIMLSGEEIDRASIDRAAEILKQSNIVSSKITDINAG